MARVVREERVVVVTSVCRRVAAVLFSLVLLLAFTACGGGEGEAGSGEVVPPVIVIEPTLSADTTRAGGDATVAPDGGDSGDGGDSSDDSGNDSDSDSDDNGNDSDGNTTTAAATTRPRTTRPRPTTSPSGRTEPADTTERVTTTRPRATTASEPAATTERATTAITATSATAAKTEPPTSATAASAPEASHDGIELREGGSVTSKTASQFPLIVAGKDIRTAEVNVSGAEYYVIVTFTARGSDAFRLATQRLAGTGTTISVWVGGRCVIAPIVTEAITGDSCTVYGGFDRNVAQSLADELARGIANSSH